MFSLNFDRFPQILGLFPYVPSKEKLFVFPKILKTLWVYGQHLYLYYDFFITITYSSYKTGFTFVIYERAAGEVFYGTTGIC